MAIGRRTGIFSSWEEAQVQVKGYSGALCKGFRGREEADRWMNANGRGGIGGGGGGGGKGKGGKF